MQSLATSELLLEPLVVAHAEEMFAGLGEPGLYRYLDYQPSPSLEALGVPIERVMTDNGSAYKSRRFAKLLRRLGIKHVRTRPYTPRTNGRPSASSRRCCASGPMPMSIPAQDIEPTS